MNSPMTKNEARAILTQHNKWRRGDADNMPDVKELGVAIDAAIVALSDSESREPMTENEMKQVISETSALARFKYQDFVRAIERFHGIGE
jgi:hypothetical protein